MTNTVCVALPIQPNFVASNSAFLPSGDKRLEQPLERQAVLHDQDLGAVLRRAIVEMVGER